MIKKLLAALLMALLPSGAFAASSATWTTNDNVADNLRLVTITWTAHTDGTFDETATNATYAMDINGFVCLVVTDPLGTAPTALYDITLKDSDGVDIMGDTLANRSATATEQAVPAIGAAYGCRYVAGPLTLDVTNNSVNAATGEIKIYVLR